jgi:L-rhamnose 1-dehydrogenase
MSLLAGKAAAITGGVTGIGRAIAIEYLKQGASVAVNHLDDASSDLHFKSLVEESGAGADTLTSVVGDISQPDTARRLVENTVEAFGKLDIFVSNAGICRFADFLT